MSENEIISFCGIVCSQCEAYIATMKDDDELRQKTAEHWSKTYGADIKAEHINCRGCLSTEEPLFSHCKVCEYRLCGIDKGVENCAHCNEYPCEKLAKFHGMVPQCKETLDKIKENL
ncbi:MAG: DUF3795 domain-containing protein [Planctomycetes bacterium]|nr:DUF3795 domain-containing protein [Planctomycetota bacterium]